MKLMVIGGGGREHAIIRALKKSPRVDTIYALPGNAGMEGDAILVPIGAKDIPAQVDFAKSMRSTSPWWRRMIRWCWAPWTPSPKPGSPALAPRKTPP